MLRVRRWGSGNCRYDADVGFILRISRELPGGSPKLCGTYPKVKFHMIEAGESLSDIVSPLLSIDPGRSGVPPANQTEEHTGSDGPSDAL